MGTVPQMKFDSYYSYDEMTEFLNGCAEAAGDVMTVESIVRSPEGREVWLATLTDPATGGPEDKPAYYVQANVHARELAGTTAALRFLHTLLTEEQARESLKGLTVYVVPRTNPDGAEYALTLNGPIRSKIEVVERKNGLIQQDLNGDGKITNMRWEDPAGPLTEDPEDPRIMVPRRPGDTGPFYQQITEGIIHDYDGGNIGSSMKGFDFNRHYPANWDLHTDVADYPLQHDEMRGIAEFLMSHHNIFGGIDFHCGTQAVLRPSTKPDSDMNQTDLGMIIEIGKQGAQHTGFDLMSARDYREPWRQPTVLHGNSNDFAYFELGISWYVVELGNAFSSAGISGEDYFNADAETRNRDFMRRVMKFHDENPQQAWTWHEWEEFDHPQLGKVEIGGIGGGNIIMPYPPHIEDTSAGTTGFLLEHTTWHPQIALSGIEVEAIAEGVYRLRAKVANVGRMATNVMSTGLNARTADPVRVTIGGLDESQIVSRPRSYELAALASGAFEPLEWFVTAPAGTEVTLTAAHPRGGIVEEALALG
jgi:hypothetical protein